MLFSIEESAYNEPMLRANSQTYSYCVAVGFTLSPIVFLQQYSVCSNEHAS